MKRIKLNVYRLYYEDRDFYYTIDVSADNEASALKYAEARALDNELERSNDMITYQCSLSKYCATSSLGFFIPIIDKTYKDDVI